jgi:methionyl-tRNA formyltransferase
VTLVVAGKGPAFERIVKMVDCVPVPSGQPLVDGDVLLSVQYDRIVKQHQIDGYRQALNLHFGVLPYYRGCFPTKWAIINGEPAGVTLHHMTAGIDEGPIVDINYVTTQGATDDWVYDRCNRAAVQMFAYWKKEILAGQVPPGNPQNEAVARYYPRELPYGGRVPEGAPDWLVDRLRRAFHHPPYPGLVE